jgi:uncharacterized protein YraI
MGQPPGQDAGPPPPFVPTSRKPPPPKEPGALDLQAVLRNRFILGGLGVLVVLLLAAIVLFAVGGDGNKGATVSGQPTVDGADATAVIGPGLRGRMTATVGSRAGPGTTYPFLGLITNGTLLTVVGRNADDTWYQVIYPPGSTLRVWIVSSAIAITGDTSGLVIAGPAAGPDVVVPTFAGPSGPLPTEPGGTEIDETPTVDAQPTRRPTFTPPPTWTPVPTNTPQGPVATPGNERPTP